MLARGGDGARCSSVGDRVAAGGLAQDLLVQRLGLLLRLDTELAREHAHALLVLAQRRAPSAGVGVEAHQRAVRWLLQRIEGQQSKGRLNRRLDRANLALMREQPRERFERQLTQSLTLAEQPFF